MKVLLLEDVRGLGKKGEVCEVKDGYGQNFLIAKNKAKHATNEVINKYKAEVRKKEEQTALEIAEKKQLIKTIESLSVKISKKAGNNNALFGAITKDDIAENLKIEHKLEIDKKDIEIKNPIKTLGTHEVEIKLGHQISGKLKIEVLAQN
ncbi:50S ribosomal protein L9 [Helicobacter anseris]|uniref:Large ribosomal subunit protein bL9 n=1 Tax=Helicobacter anseris TaxID=375926 RepID=A0A3D8JA93_9HELI|nr:50S ribosomal protein L9 [Helicobacter anseris]RDU74389.1 50S ribosomal protein L9 [Helicobacter anseris]